MDKLQFIRGSSGDLIGPFPNFDSATAHLDLVKKLRSIFLVEQGIEMDQESFYVEETISVEEHIRRLREIIDNPCRVGIEPRIGTDIAPAMKKEG